MMAETSDPNPYNALFGYKVLEDLGQTIPPNPFSPPKLPALRLTSQMESEVQVFPLSPIASVNNELANIEVLPGDALELVGAPRSELVVVSPLAEEKRRKIKRARVVKDIQTLEVENVEGQELKNPLQKERGELGKSLRRFVARMRDVQGDRQFSKWKGSVVDSIVGTFLTQNVSDHLSSSAYMNLAARWAPGKENPSKSNAVNGALLSKVTPGMSAAEAARLAGTHASQSPSIEDIEDAGGVPFKPDAAATQPDVDTWRCQEHIDGRERSSMHEDGVNWEAVRAASVDELADAIKERGMQTMLAARIKSFLEKVKTEHGSIDLECLRERPAESTRAFLRGLYGLGGKSAECILLLCLHQLAFPVDTNVGRICVRLGWVRLEPLDEEVQLHLLDQYPIQQRLQEYLWRRLSHLDQRELYELHYQLITFGKVFCTKRQPNCLACPMQDECAHYASAKAHKEQKLAIAETDPKLSQPVPSSRPTELAKPLEKKGGRPRKDLSVVGQPGESNARIVKARAWFTEARDPSELPLPEPNNRSLFEGAPEQEAGLFQAFSSLRRLVTKLTCPVQRPEPRRLSARSPDTCPVGHGFQSPFPASYPQPRSPLFGQFAPRLFHPLGLSEPLSVTDRPLLPQDGRCPASPKAVTCPPPVEQRTTNSGAQIRGLFCYPVADNRAAFQSREERMYGPEELPCAPFAQPTALLRSEARLSPPLIEGVASRRGSQSVYVASAEGLGVAWKSSPRLSEPGTLGEPDDALLHSPVDSSELCTWDFGPTSEADQPGTFNRKAQLSSRHSVFVKSSEGPGLAWQTDFNLDSRGPPAVSRTSALSPGLTTSDFGPLSTGALQPGEASGASRRHPSLINSLEGLDMAWQTSSQRGTAGGLDSLDSPTESKDSLQTREPPVASPELATCDFGPMFVPRALFPSHPLETSFAANPLPSEIRTLPAGGWCRTGLPDLNLYPPVEETARELQAAVKGAVKEAKKRGVGKKRNPPTTFWALPSKRPEKLRTVRHAVRLPDDHPLLKQFGPREEDDPSPFLAVLWPASLVTCPPGPVPYAPESSTCPPDLAPDSQTTGTWAPDASPGSPDPATCSPDLVPGSDEQVTCPDTVLPRRPSDAGLSDKPIEALPGEPVEACHPQSPLSAARCTTLQTHPEPANIPLSDEPSIDLPEESGPSNAADDHPGPSKSPQAMGKEKELETVKDKSIGHSPELDRITAEQSRADVDFTADLEPPKWVQELENLADTCLGARGVPTGHDEEPCALLEQDQPGNQPLDWISSRSDGANGADQRLQASLKRPRSGVKRSSWHLKVKREMNDTEEVGRERKVAKSGDLKEETESELEAVPRQKRKRTVDELDTVEEQERKKQRKLANAKTGLLTRSKRRKLEEGEQSEPTALRNSDTVGNIKDSFTAADKVTKAKRTAFLVRDVTAQKHNEVVNMATNHDRPTVKLRFTKSILNDLPVKGRRTAGFVERMLAKPGRFEKDGRGFRRKQSHKKPSLKREITVATKDENSLRFSKKKSPYLMRRVYETRRKADGRKKIEKLSIGERIARGLQRRITTECLLQRRKAREDPQAVPGDSASRSARARAGLRSKGKAHPVEAGEGRRRQSAQTSRNRGLGFSGKPRDSRARECSQPRLKKRKRFAAEVIDLSESDEEEAKQSPARESSGDEQSDEGNRAAESDVEPKEDPTEDLAKPRASAGFLDDSQTSVLGAVKGSTSPDPINHVPEADVTPQHDDVLPWPATPEKVLPARPQASPSPEKVPGGSARSVVEERAKAAEEGPVEEQVGEEGTCTCSTCSCEQSEATVFVTLLIPCRTAMAGRFPLNGTYFQTNELFADYASSINPLTVSFSELAGLPRCKVNFGTSASNMFRGCSLAEIKDVFQRGYICVRGFDSATRAPKPLSTRLHAATTVKKRSAPADVVM